MPYQINIANIKINGVTQNGNIDVGPTVHNSHTANSKYFGANFSLGDLSPTSSLL
ncbi:spore germination protein, partial [Bacillus subtilis]